MVRAETKQLVPGAKTAVLFIHGFLGNPGHFDMLTPLVPDTVTLYNLQLDGHGKSPRDFGRTCMANWERQVHEAVDELSASHQQILIVGHSMGTLFAIEQALRTDKVKALFLIAIPITPWPGLQLLRNAHKIYWDKIDDKYSQAAAHCYGIGSDKNLLHYCRWVPRYFDLFRKVGDVRKILPDLHTPCTAYQSIPDEMVSRRSIPYLEKHGHFPVRVLERSNHTYYDPEETQYLQAEFAEFLNKNAPE